MEELQGAVNSITNWMQLLAASLSMALDDPNEGPMSLWEAIRALLSSITQIKGISDSNLVYLEDLKKHLPNWGRALQQLTVIYFDNLPKMNTGLLGC
jgi:hypothetical protein